VTARPAGSIATAGSTGTSTPTAPATVDPAGATGTTDLTPVIVAIVFVGFLVAGAAYLGLSRRKPAA
jgi:hypothetical protein